jgi:PAS domain S-box-containing protein
MSGRLTRASARALLAILLAAQAGAVASAGAGTVEQQSPAAPPPRRVLALYWYPRSNPITATFERKIQEVLNHQPGEFEYYSEALEPDRFSGELHDRIMLEFLRDKYADRQIDVLLAWSPLALSFLLKHRSTLFPNSPIVFYSSSLESVNEFTTELTGVVNDDAYEKTVALALHLHPDTTQAFFISGTPDHGKTIEQEARRQLEAFRDRISVTYLTDLPLDQLIATVKGLPPRSIIFYSRQSQDDLGRALLPTDFLQLISRASPVPVYSPWRSLLGHGTVGGIVDDPEAGATKAAQLVVRVARGARPGDLPIERVPKTPMFDARQLQRWAIAESRLPAASVILFREPTLWRQYRAYIIGLGIVLGVQSTLIAGLLVQRTRRRRLEHDLRESQQRYALATAAASAGVWDWNVETNEVWIDPSLERNLGFDDLGITNCFDSWMQRVHPDDAGRVRDDIRAHIDGQTRFYETEHRKLHQDGTVRWFLTRGSAVRAADGRAVRIIASDTDITQRKIAEAQLEEMRHELMRVSRVTMLAQFAASIAHEVRQPLNAVYLNAKACLRWLEDSGTSIETLRPALRDIGEAATRATEVISRHGELFRYHRVEKGVVNVNTIVRDVIVLAMTRLQQSQVALETALDNNLPLVLGDRVELQQVLLNLVLNAIEAMATTDPSSRRLRIHTSFVEPNLVQVNVRDAGAGLKGSDISRLFAPFYTTKPAGTGVGLSISRLIVDAHGGKLWAEPTDGRGTTFCFSIPIAADEAAEPATDIDADSYGSPLGRELPEPSRSTPSLS